MKRAHLDFAQYKKEVLAKDSRLRVEYEKLQPEFALVEAVLRARMKRKLTQKALAETMGTKQSAISRLESGMANPSLKFLNHLAETLGFRLEIHLVPKQAVA
jgi:ribosome-binding protein aMBF1 (putative translation factor)